MRNKLRTNKLRTPGGGRACINALGGGVVGREKSQHSETEVAEEAQVEMDSNEIDVVDNGAIVKVFLLEGAFPWNTPPAILDNSGAFWENYCKCFDFASIVGC